MRVGIYASCRNEAKNIDAWYASTEGADVVVVNDSGSTDDSVERLRALGVEVQQQPADDSAFARFNLALSLLPDDVDLAIRLDLDERLSPGWREALDECAIDGPTVLQPWFDHGGIVYRHDRVHSRHGFRWDLPLHEVLVCDGPFTKLTVEFTIEHHQDFTKDRSSTVPLLEQALADDPTNLRMIHYLGREYTYYARWAEAIPLLHQHARSDAFPEERSESWRLLGDCYRALLPIEDVSRRPFFQAAITAPERREGWLALAEWHYDHGDWKQVRAAAEKALSITERSWYFNHPNCWGSRPYDLAALASFYLGETADAIRYGEQALELASDDARLVENLRWYRGKVAA